MIRMPWNNRTAPNVMLDVTDACNADCRACYHPRGNAMKSLGEVERDLDAAARLRDLHTVTLSGGEPTLHPKLVEIVRRVKARGYHCFLLTNGVSADRTLLRDLAGAGLDSVLFHVDSGQTRKDLPAEPDLKAVQRRLHALARSAECCGVEPAASFTVYPDRWEQLFPMVEYFLHSPDLTFLFLSNATDPRSFSPVPMTAGEASSAEPSPPDSAHSVGRFMEEMQRRYRWSPFSFIPSTLPGKQSPAPFLWVSYFLPVVFRDGRLTAQYRFRSTPVDRLLIQLPRLLTGRHVHKTRQQPLVTLARVVTNGVARGRTADLFGYLRSSLVPRAKVRHKMIVYDGGPFLRDGHEPVYCEYCPTAIVRNGRLFRCCTLQLEVETQ